MQIYTNIALATNNSVDSIRCGEVNGLATTASSLGKALASFTCAPLFAWSINGNNFGPFGAHFCFTLLALGMLAVSIIGWNSIKNKQNEEDTRAEIVEMISVGNLV